MSSLVQESNWHKDWLLWAPLHVDVKIKIHSSTPTFSVLIWTVLPNASLTTKYIKEFSFGFHIVSLKPCAEGCHGKTDLKMKDDLVLWWHVKHLSLLFISAIRVQAWVQKNVKKTKGNLLHSSRRLMFLSTFWWKRTRNWGAQFHLRWISSQDLSQTMTDTCS